MAENDLPNMIGSPVKDFVSSLFEGIEEGLKQRDMKMCKESDAHAKMELNAIATGETSGKGGAKILGFGGEVEGTKSNTNSQKVTVFVRKEPKIFVA
jgi:type V secretory pathway adhesin AidA